MTEDGKTKLTTREWVFVLFLLALMQFIVQASAFVYCGKGNALNYWSLVGTSVSIILALLAIIRSFIQNMVQQKGSASIASQIERLQSVVVEANKSGAQFSSQIERLEDVRTQMQETATLTRQAREDITTMGKQVEATQKLVEGLTQKPQEQAPVGKPAVAKGDADAEFFARSSLTGALAIYICYLSHAHKVAFDLTKTCQALKYLEPLYVHGYLVASSSAGILNFTVAQGIFNVTEFSAVVAENIRENLLGKVAALGKATSSLQDEFTKNVEIVDAMLADK